MNGEGAFYLLTDTDLMLPELSDASIRQEALTVLLEDYEKLEQTYTDIEERIAKVKGLMSMLLTHKAKNAKPRKSKRKLSATSGNDD